MLGIRDSLVLRPKEEIYTLLYSESILEERAERRKEVRRQGEGQKCSLQGMTIIEIMNSLEPQLPALGLYSTGPMNSQSQRKGRPVNSMSFLLNFQLLMDSGREEVTVL